MCRPFTTNPGSGRLRSRGWTRMSGIRTHVTNGEIIPVFFYQHEGPFLKVLQKPCFPTHGVYSVTTLNTRHRQDPTPPQTTTHPPQPPTTVFPTGTLEEVVHVNPTPPLTRLHARLLCSYRFTPSTHYPSPPSNDKTNETHTNV